MAIIGIGVSAYKNRPVSDTGILVPPTETATTTPSGTVAEPPASGNSFSLKVGQKAQIGTIALTLHAVTEDSRCPANVNCIWTGRVSAEFDAVSGKTAERITLKTDSATAFAGYDFKIEAVKPQKTKTQNIPSDYTLTVSYISNN